MEHSCVLQHAYNRYSCVNKYIWITVTVEELINLHVVVHDGIQPMGDCEDGAVCKLYSDGFLDKVICLKVNSSCGLIQDKDLGFTEESSS